MQCPDCHFLFEELLDRCPQCGAVAGDEMDAGASGDSVRWPLQRALGDQYKLLSVLGRGGMGVVYLARQAGLERLVGGEGAFATDRRIGEPGALSAGSADGCRPDASRHPPRLRLW